eukprot:GEMP01006423.1.p1 GENE.GEMP01006423.1~~GEMP01006423.1.p1  ORF type:complete len:938 (+),score=190.33 GEMP01006423.1:243-3056(+)
MKDEIGLREKDMGTQDYVGTVFEYKGKPVRLIHARGRHAFVRAVEGDGDGDRAVLGEKVPVVRIPWKSALWWIKNQQEKVIENRLQEEDLRQERGLARNPSPAFYPSQFSEDSAVRCTTDDERLVGSWPFSAPGKQRVISDTVTSVSDTDLLVKTGATHEHRILQPLDNCNKKDGPFRRGDVVLAANMRGVVVGVGKALLRIRFPTHTEWVQRSKVLKCYNLRGARETNRYRRNFSDMKHIQEEASQLSIRIGAHVRVNGDVGAVVGYSALNEVMVRNSDGAVISVDVDTVESYNKERLQRLYEEGGRRQERIKERRKLHTRLRNEAEKRILDRSIHPATDKTEAEEIGAHRCLALFALATSSQSPPMHVRCFKSDTGSALLESHSPGDGEVFERLYGGAGEKAMRLDDKRMEEDIEAVNLTNALHTREPTVGWSWRAFGPEQYLTLLKRFQNLRAAHADRIDLQMKTQQVSFGIKANPNVFVRLFQEKKDFNKIQKEQPAEDLPITKRLPQREIEQLSIVLSATRTPKRFRCRGSINRDAEFGSFPGSGLRQKKKSLKELEDSIKRLSKPPRRSGVAKPGQPVKPSQPIKPRRPPAPVEVYVDAKGNCVVLDEDGSVMKTQEAVRMSVQIEESSTESEETPTDEIGTANDPLWLIANQMSKANAKAVAKKLPKKKKVKPKKRTLGDMMSWQKVAAAWMERFQDTRPTGMPPFHARREPGASKVDRNFVNTLYPVQNVEDMMAEQQANDVGNFNARHRENALNLDDYDFDPDFHFRPKNVYQEKMLWARKQKLERIRKGDPGTRGAGSHASSTPPKLGVTTRKSAATRGTISDDPRRQTGGTQRETLHTTENLSNSSGTSPASARKKTLNADKVNDTCRIRPRISSAKSHDRSHTEHKTAMDAGIIDMTRFLARSSAKLDDDTKKADRRSFRWLTNK